VSRESVPSPRHFLQRFPVFSRHLRDEFFSALLGKAGVVGNDVLLSGVPPGHAGVGRKQHFLPPNEPLYGTRPAGDA
jgi:hypothetical protein